MLSNTILKTCPKRAKCCESCIIFWPGSRGPDSARDGEAGSSHAGQEDAAGDYEVTRDVQGYNVCLRSKLKDKTKKIEMLKLKKSLTLDSSHRLVLLTHLQMLVH